MITPVPAPILDFLKTREGFRLNTYADSLGKLTGGMGHLLSPAEAARFPLNAPIPVAVAEAWAQADSSRAFAQATAQAAQVGVTDAAFVQELTSVNFQMTSGISWTNRFPNTWKLILAHRWEDAAVNIGKSLWAKETPQRVKDFQAALRALIR